MRHPPLSLGPALRLAHSGREIFTTPPFQKPRPLYISSTSQLLLLYSLFWPTGSETPHSLPHLLLDTSSCKSALLPNARSQALISPLLPIRFCFLHLCSFIHLTNMNYFLFNTINCSWGSCCHMEQRISPSRSPHGLRNLSLSLHMHS